LVPSHYWQVYFDTNRAIRDTFAAAGYPVPEAHQVMRTEPAHAALAESRPEMGRV
jgi:small conductance mechanosensitive channel